MSSRALSKKHFIHIFKCFISLLFLLLWAVRQFLYYNVNDYANIIIGKPPDNTKNRHSLSLSLYVYLVEADLFQRYNVVSEASGFEYSLQLLYGPLSLLCRQPKSTTLWKWDISIIHVQVEIMWGCTIIHFSINVNSSIFEYLKAKT